jgi:hypothetical protein
MKVNVVNDDHVLRRVPTYLPNYIKPDGSISSLAYYKKRDENGISVNLERLSSYNEAVLGDSRFRLLRLNVGKIRVVINDGLEVIHDPVEQNFAHSLIIGTITENKKKQLVKHSEEVIAGS